MEAALQVPHSIIFVYDPDHDGLEIPDWSGKAPAQASESCVSIGTLCEMDGSTRIALLPEASELAPSAALKVFDGEIETPGRQLWVNTSEELGLLTSKVPQLKTHIEVLVNRSTKPDEILIRVKV